MDFEGLDIRVGDGGVNGLAQGAVGRIAGAIVYVVGGVYGDSRGVHRPDLRERGIGSAANIRVPILKKEPTEVDRQALFFIWWRRGREPVFPVPAVWGSSLDDDGGDGLRNCFTPIDD